MRRRSFPRMAKMCPVCGASYPDNNIFCATDGTTLRAADADGDLVGSVIADRYLVTDLLGEGGMGKVYLARHVRLPQQAAIKVLRPEQVRDASAIARFNREAANASRIDHDRVARVYDFGETDDGIVYLAMEYVAGRTLKAVLTDGGPLAPARTANVVRQIADGLDAAHRLGIVHRDLKPDNVLLIPGEAADGSDDRVKVVDFGIAKALGGDGQAEPGLTRTGFVVGTPEFMSPEQLLGGAIDARSDVYALAILAYQCLTGQLPFDTNSPDRGMTARLMTPPRPLSAVSVDVPWPAGVQVVLDAGLARDPSDRPATAGTFARALSAAVDAWATAARMPAEPATASRAAPVLVAATQAPMPAIVSAAAEVPATVRSVRDDARTVPRARTGLLVGTAVGAVLVIAAGAFALTRRSPSAAPEPTRVSGSGAITTGPVAPDPVTTGAAPPTQTAAPRGGTADSASTAGPRSTTRGGAASGATNDTRTTGGDRGPSAPPPRVVVPPTRVVTERGAPTAGSGVGAGRRTLDSITAALDPDTAHAQTGRAAIGALRALLPRLTTGSDSAWALVRTVDAYVLAGDQGRACTAMRSARTAARSDAQREAIHRYESALDCP